MRQNYKDKKFLGLGNDLISFTSRDQRKGSRRYYLWYPIQFMTQSNNNKMRFIMI